MNTRLIKGDEEPLYLPTDEAALYHRECLQVVDFCDILPLFEVSTWLQFLFIVLAAIQMKFIGMVLVQLSANASGVSAVTVYSQLTYRYEARKPGVKEQIIDMAFNGARVRDTARS